MRLHPPVEGVRQDALLVRAPSHKKTKVQKYTSAHPPGEGVRQDALLAQRLIQGHSHRGGGHGNQGAGQALVDARAAGDAMTGMLRFKI